MKKGKTLMDYDEKLSEDAELLSRYLYQYKDCIGKKHALEHRMEQIKYELKHPVSAIRYDKDKAKPSEPNEGSVAIVYRLDEIHIRINQQIGKAEKILVEIMNIIDFLPENSFERTIIENKYIDRMNWEKICNENHSSKSRTSRYWKKGLYKLLEYEKVRKTLDEYKKSM